MNDLKNNFAALISMKRATKTTCEAFKISDLQARILMAVYVANRAGKYPDMGDVIVIMGEAQRQGLYTPMRQLCSKRLIYGTENRARTDKRGKFPLQYTVSPKGFEILTEFDIILTSYSL